MGSFLVLIKFTRLMDLEVGLKENSLELLQRSRRDRRILLNFILSGILIKKVVMPPGAVSLDDVDLDQLVDFVLNCARKGGLLELSDSTLFLHMFIQILVSQFHTTTRVNNAAADLVLGLPSFATVFEALNTCVGMYWSKYLMSKQFNIIFFSSISWLYFFLAIGDDDLCQTAYEILLAAAGASGGLIVPSKDKKKEKKSRLMKKLGRSKSENIYEAMDVRTRLGLLNAMVGKRWVPVSPQQTHGSSIVEVYRIVEETVDQFFALEVPMRPGELGSLFCGIDNAFQVYAKTVLDKIALKDTRIPDVLKSVEIDIAAISTLCVQLNSLHGVFLCTGLIGKSWLWPLASFISLKLDFRCSTSYRDSIRNNISTFKVRNLNPQIIQSISHIVIKLLELVNIYTPSGISSVPSLINFEEYNTVFLPFYSGRRQEQQSHTHLSVPEDRNYLNESVVWTPCTVFRQQVNSRGKLAGAGALCKALCSE
ncbi:hypothetical protein KY284_015265 [Solanum tuberosum]|nr:hypothetical protein KY284_015265 [Solanum tuberosum]